MEAVRTSLASVTMILIAMGALSLLESAIPLFARNRWNRAHLLPNLALTSFAFVAFAILHGAVIVVLLKLETRELGLLPPLGLGALWTTVVSVLALDLVTYGAHVAMHKLPMFWRFHRIHHADPSVDVTTSLRQHPAESVIRVAFLAACAIPLGISPAAYAIYRLASGLWALLEHANIRIPARLDDALALVVTWPTMHKVHHSRDENLTDTNYGNLVSWWDRLFGTFTPARVGAAVVYGLHGFDDPATQTTRALLVAPLSKTVEDARPCSTNAESHLRAGSSSRLVRR